MSAAYHTDTCESPSDCATTIQHKKRERAELDALLVSFRAGGGKVQVLGNTEWKQPLSMRKANERRVTTT